MTTFTLKRIEWIEVDADNLEEALDKFGDGAGNHIHETEEYFKEIDGDLVPATE